jgi:hypothetical protein
MRYGVVAMLCGALLPPGRAAAQLEASVGAGVSTVRLSDGRSFGAVTLAPSVRLFGRARFAAAHGSLAALPDGAWSGQLRVDAWDALTRPSGRGVAVAGSLAGSALSSAPRAGSAELLGEVFASVDERGVALAAGVALGSITGLQSVTATRLRARAWWQHPMAHYSLTIEPTGLEGRWYTDVQVGVTVERARVSLTGSVVGRIGQSSDQLTGNVAATWRPSERWAVEGGVGGFLADPLLGYGRARSVSAGMRAFFGARAVRLTAPLAARRVGDSVVVRVRVPGAASVAIAGDWSAWSPVPLREVGKAQWEGVLAIAPGTHRFNLLVDGTRWLVPAGIAVVTDDLGGTAGLLVVP